MHTSNVCSACCALLDFYKVCGTLFAGHWRWRFRYPAFVVVFGTVGALIFFTASVGVLSADLAAWGVGVFIFGCYHALMLALVVLQLAALLFYHTDSLHKQQSSPHSGEIPLSFCQCPSVEQLPHPAGTGLMSSRKGAGAPSSACSSEHEVAWDGPKLHWSLLVHIFFAVGDNARDSPELRKLVSADLKHFSLVTLAVLSLTLSTLVVSHHAHSAQHVTRQQRRQLSVSHSSNLLSRPVCLHAAVACCERCPTLQSVLLTNVQLWYVVSMWYTNVRLYSSSTGALSVLHSVPVLMTAAPSCRIHSK